METNEEIIQETSSEQEATTSKFSQFKNTLTTWFAKCKETLTSCFNKCKESTIQFCKNEKTQKGLSITKTLLPWAWLIVCFSILCIFMETRVDYLLDSDMSSELVFSKLLVDEGKWVLTENWYYSTEIRIVNFHLIMVPLMHIFKSWHTVRVVGSIIMYLILLACLFYFCYQAKITKLFPYIGAVLMLPFCFNYAKYTLYGLMYLPYMDISFILLGLAFHFANTKKKWLSWMITILTAAFSLIVGIQGLRQFLLYFIPVAITVFIVFVTNKDEESKKTKLKFTANIIISLFSAFIGYIIYTKHICETYTFQQYNNISFRNFSFTTLQTVIIGWFESLGFVLDKVFSKALICNAVCFITIILFVLSIVHFFKNKDKYSFAEHSIILFTILAFSVFSLFYVFVNMGYTGRYNLPVFIFLFPQLAIFIKNCDWKPYFKVTFTIAFAVLLSISSIFTYKTIWKIDNTKHFKEITQVLLDNECYNGYATFWSCNVLSELSDGKLDVRNWDYNRNPNNVNIDTIDGWLQRKDQETIKPTGKVFLLFTQKELSTHKLPKLLDRNKVEYESNSYILFIYDSYEELISTPGIQHN